MEMRRRRVRRAVPALADPEMARVTLLAIAEQGCALQSRADAVLALAAFPGERRADLAREGGHLAGEFHRLFGWAGDVAVHTDECCGLQQELAELLMHHCQVVHHAIRLAFPKYHVPDEHRRTVCLELGEPALRLQALAARLRDQL